MNEQEKEVVFCVDCEVSYWEYDPRKDEYDITDYRVLLKKETNKAICLEIWNLEGGEPNLVGYVWLPKEIIELVKEGFYKVSLKKLWELYNSDEERYIREAQKGKKVKRFWNMVSPYHFLWIDKAIRKKGLLKESGK